MAPRDMTTHMLTPLRFYHDGTHLICNATPDPTEAAQFQYLATPAGRCMHLVPNTGPGQKAAARLGCQGNNKIPVFIYRASDSYSAGFVGPDVTTDLMPGWDAGGTGNILMFVGMEGFELQTTEFDKTQTYNIGDYLVAPEYDPGAVNPVTQARDVAGVLTNFDATLNIPGKPLHGASTIVGQVSPNIWEPMGFDRSAGGHQLSAYQTEVLSFYTKYDPPIEGLSAAVIATPSIP